jgi:hypothetical protein
MKLFAKPLSTTITPMEKPQLRVHNSVVPQEFLTNFGKTFDSELYTKQEIIK